MVTEETEETHINGKNPFSWTYRINTVKTLTLSKAIYRFNSIATKTKMAFF
jgi:hypothetical protein